MNDAECIKLKASIFDLILTRDEYLAKAKYTSDEIQRLMLKLKEMNEHGSNESAGISPV